jgi:hypothetical protein
LRAVYRDMSSKRKVAEAVMRMITGGADSTAK